MQNIVPVILCGGGGTRLWPLSRKSFPKQFLKFGNASSLFQQVLERVSADSHYSAPIVLTNDDYRFLVAEQAREINVALDTIILEPSAKNTAPAIAAAAYHTLSDNSLLHILASDHLIIADKEYQDTIHKAVEVAQMDYLVTFGIEPSYPATGYGYVKASQPVTDGIYQVEKFLEKPDLQTAQAMIEEGGYSWNSGMFIFKAQHLISELEKFAPEVAASVASSYDKAYKDLDFLRLDADSFNRSPSISIDYAIFEKTEQAAVVSADISWSDVGSWKSLHETQPKDKSGNTIIGASKTIDSENNMIVSDGPLIATSGISDTAIIATKDAVLVTPLKQSEIVKDVVELLGADSATEILAKEHPLMYRPWGGYCSIEKGENYQVKRLFVTPGKSLSLQKHQFRTEHWVVVGGVAEVTLDENIHILNVNESIYIPLGAAHRLANRSDNLLEVIEVQCGSYLGEDDIIRLEDEFGRTVLP